ncbi:hypothetical protein Q9233_013721 [Columba guinea]|nr:hypothetical protein Q9233_013721 [Columba guinea]
MAEPVAAGVSSLPREVREQLAELELELSEGTRPGDECPEYAPKRDFKGSDSDVFFTVFLIVLNRTVGPVRD